MLDYDLIFERPNKSVKESNKEITEYVLKKTKDMIKELSAEKQEILREKLLYSMNSHIKHGTRLRNAYRQILYALKKKGLKEPELTQEASKAYIYSKIISKQFSSIIQNDKRYIKKSLDNIINEYKEGIKKLEQYLYSNNRDKLIEYILANIKDVTQKLTKEEKERLKKRLLENCEKGNAPFIFNKIYEQLKKEGIKQEKLEEKVCKIYVFGIVGPIGFSSVISNDKKYADKNLKRIRNMMEEQIEFLDYYLLYGKTKGIKEENRELTENIYLEINRKFPNLTKKQKTQLKKGLLKNEENLRFINAYYKIYYRLKSLKKEEAERISATKQIYASIKLREKGFYDLTEGRIYRKDEISEERIEECLNNFQELDWYLLENYKEKSKKEADQLITQKVLEKSEILNQLNRQEEKQIKKLLLKNNEKKARLIMAYNRIYFELSKKGIKEPELSKETSKAYIYAKIARCGFSEIQNNRRGSQHKLQKVIKEYQENINDISFYLMNRKENESDIILTHKILEDARDILRELNQEEKVKLKQKLIYNANKDINLIKAYRKIYYELRKKGITKQQLEEETAKAYIYAKIGPDGFCDIRDNTKSSKKILEKVINHYREGIGKIRYYLLDFLDDKRVKEADLFLIKNIVLKTKRHIGELSNCPEFIESLNYNSQNKSKMIIVYNKIYFELLKKGLKEPKLSEETSKAFIYAKIGPEGFKQIQNGNSGADEYVKNVIKYYDKGLEIIKEDYRNHRIDFTKRVLYQKRTIRKRIESIDILQKI